MNTADPNHLVRAILGELSPEAQRMHTAQLLADPAYRAAHHELLGITTELRALQPSTPTTGLDQRVLAALRNRRGVQVVPQQFWRLALPALVTASMLVTLAIRDTSRVAPTATMTLASWYPISTDPTLQP